MLKLKSKLSTEEWTPGGVRDALQDLSKTQNPPNFLPVLHMYIDIYVYIFM